MATKSSANILHHRINEGLEPIMTCKYLFTDVFTGSIRLIAVCVQARMQTNIFTH